MTPFFSQTGDVRADSDATDESPCAKEGDAGAREMKISKKEARLEGNRIASPGYQLWGCSHDSSMDTSGKPLSFVRGRGARRAAMIESMATVRITEAELTRDVRAVLEKLSGATKSSLRVKITVLWP